VQLRQQRGVPQLLRLDARPQLADLLEQRLALLAVPALPVLRAPPPDGREDAETERDRAAD
jgi:hypothetical protein